MPASILGSFISFFFIGIYTWFFIDMDMQFGIKISLFISILANAIYFFYFEALTELDDSLQSRLLEVGAREWYLRMFNQTLLFSLWFLLELHPIAFCIGLIFLYFSFLTWDYITSIPNDTLFYLDVAGLVLTIIFIFFFIDYLYFPNGEAVSSSATTTQNNRSPNFIFLWGIVATLYALIPIIGFTVTKWELFKKEYWTRPKIT